VNQASDKAVSIAEAANLDLIEFTNRLPLTEKVDFYLSSVRGLTQSYADADYQLELRGLGFGFAPAGRQYSVKITLGDAELPATQVQALAANETRVKIPHTSFEPFFKDDKVQIVKAKVALTVTKETRFLLIFPNHETNQYSAELSLVLLPRLPGTVTGKEPLRTMVLDPTIHTTSVVHHTQNCHPRQPCDWTQEVDLAADEYAVNVRYGCSGQCGWDYAKRHGGNGIDFDIVNDGHKIVVYRHFYRPETTKRRLLVRDHSTIGHQASALPGQRHGL
jgi:hypothetical protein